MLHAQIVLFAAAMQFLTRLPMPDTGWEEGRLARAQRYFPLVGALVGGVAGAVFWLGAQALPPVIAAGLALGAGMLLTGALHEDGLADTMDALGGDSSRDRALEIMRDSRIGSYGALALIVSVGLRWSALASLAPVTGALALVIAGATGRMLMVPLSRVLPYAREDGAGRAVSQGGKGGEVPIAVATALALGLAAGWLGLIALGVAAVLTAMMAIWFARRIGGYTGDSLGAVEQVGEISVLLVFATAYTGVQP
ncbi:MAG: adenosylcobinamide-GDP ribazoletransferase [Pseudomonadota bacterium]